MKASHACARGPLCRGASATHLGGGCLRFHLVQHVIAECSQRGTQSRVEPPPPRVNSGAHLCRDVFNKSARLGEHVVRKDGGLVVCFGGLRHALRHLRRRRLCRFGRSLDCLEGFRSCLPLLLISRVLLCSRAHRRPRIRLVSMSSEAQPLPQPAPHDATRLCLGMRLWSEYLLSLSLSPELSTARRLRLGAES